MKGIKIKKGTNDKVSLELKSRVGKSVLEYDGTNLKLDGDRIITESTLPEPPSDSTYILTNYTGQVLIEDMNTEYSVINVPLSAGIYMLNMKSTFIYESGSETETTYGTISISAGNFISPSITGIRIPILPGIPSSEYISVLVEESGDFNVVVLVSNGHENSRQVNVTTFLQVLQLQ